MKKTETTKEEIKQMKSTLEIVLRSFNQGLVSHHTKLRTNGIHSIPTPLDRGKAYGS